MSKWSDAQEGEALARLGDGEAGGYLLVSAYSEDGCVGYPIAVDRLITSASCVSACAQDELCELAVMSAEGGGALLGLMRWAALEPSSQQWGEPGVAVIALDRARLSPRAVAPTLPLGSEERLSLLGELRTVSSFNGTRGRLTSTGRCASSSAALLSERGELVGLSLGVEGACDEFVSLSAVASFISEASTPQFEPAPSPAFEPEPEPEPELEPEPENNRADEVAAALSRAPSSCDEQSLSYCDGEVELRCQSGRYEAFDCLSVGWRCVTSELWGGNCEP